MRRVYLCSRINKNFRTLNNQVAASLRQHGFSVYVPHEQPINSEVGGSNEDIYQQDMEAMTWADLCVVVGSQGKDMSFEIGWFWGKQKPIYFVPGGDEAYLQSPMMIPALESKVVIDEPEAAGEVISALEKKRY